MNVAVIPARGGSKRIPRKNIKEFLGKPIIAYSIEAALNSGCFDSVIVSTDDKEIASIAESLGASVPFLRPIELSDDFTPLVPVVAHAVDELSGSVTKLDFVCCILPTAPFLQPKDLSNSLLQFKVSRSRYLASVVQYAYPIQRALRINNEGTVSFVNREFALTRSQDLEEAFHDAGQFYWGKADAFSKNDVIFGVETSSYVLPPHCVQDIDTEADWLRAELMYSALESAP